MVQARGPQQKHGSAMKERPLTDKGAREVAEAILTPPFNRHGDWSRVPELAKWVLTKPSTKENQHG